MWNALPWKMGSWRRYFCYNIYNTQKVPAIVFTTIQGYRNHLHYALPQTHGAILLSKPVAFIQRVYHTKCLSQQKCWLFYVD